MRASFVGLMNAARNRDVEIWSCFHELSIKVDLEVCTWEKNEMHGKLKQ